MTRKPLGIKSYGHIPHLPGSRMGPSDHHCHEGQARIATQKARDRHDHIIVQEKLDGCLAYRTPVWTDRGPIDIGKIVNQRLPVQVASYNEMARLVEFKPIVEYHKQSGTKQWLRIIVRGLKHGASKKQLVCTPNHRFYSKGQYKRADELTPGDVVHLSGVDIPRIEFQHRACVLDGVVFEPPNSLFESVVVAVETENIEIWQGGESQYDLTVADNHNYFASDILVHNSNVAVARLDDRIVALTRAGYVASTSPYEQHHHFEKWAHRNRDRFLAALQNGERLVGEWLMQAHGTRYQLAHEPFVAFDLMVGQKRMPYDELVARAASGGFVTPHLLHRGGPLSIEDALRLLGTYGFHGALDPAEGAVWRVERNEQYGPGGRDRRWIVDFLVKYVRPDKVDGAYLPEVSGQPPVWNWWPE